MAADSPRTFARFGEPGRWGRGAAICVALLACTSRISKPPTSTAPNHADAGESARTIDAGGPQERSGADAAEFAGSAGRVDQAGASGKTETATLSAGSSEPSAGGANAGASGAAGIAGSLGGASCGVAAGSIVATFSDPIATTDVAPPAPPGIALKDTDGKAVNAHGGGIIKVCDTFYLHGEYFLSTTTDNNFNGFSMYSSKDLTTWKNEGIILPQQASGQLGPNRKGERPHIIQCPASGEFVLYAHSADVSYQADKEVVYATSASVNGQYSFKGSLTNPSGTIAAHSDMSALTDGNSAYVVTESGWVYTLSSDCHSWTSAKQYSAVNGKSAGIEAPTIFKAGSTYYWIGSDKTGWRANDDFYSTAPSMSGPWTYQGYLAPTGKLTWMTQSTWVMPVTGSEGTTYVYWGDHWYGNQDTSAPGKHNDLATYVFQPLVFDRAAIALPTYKITWKLDIGAGTWSN